MHESKMVILKAREFLSEWLKQIGLELNPEKTRLCHSLHKHEGAASGFYFLGLHIGNNWRFCTTNGLLELAEHTEWNIPAL
jgi:hypothetical protein